MLELQIQNRDKGKGISQIRGGGLIPGVFYGPQEESAPVAVDATDFMKVWKEAGGSTIISLKGVGDDKEALIQDVTLHPVSGDILHIDFYIIERGKKLTVTVPLEYVGEAPAEKMGGVVVKILHEVEMEVRPSEIPQSIEVDLSALETMEDTIVVGDLKLPESAETALGKTDIVASMSEVKEEPEEEQEERSVEDIEVEEKGKKEDTDTTQEEAE